MRDTKTRRTNFSEPGALFRPFCKNRSKIRPQICPATSRLSGPFWLVRPNNPPVGNTAQCQAREIGGGGGGGGRSRREKIVISWLREHTGRWDVADTKRKCKNIFPSVCNNWSTGFWIWVTLVFCLFCFLSEYKKSTLYTTVLGRL